MGRNRLKRFERKIMLEKMVNDNVAFCIKHNEYLTIQTIRNKRCYVGEKAGFCKNLRRKEQRGYENADT